MKKTLAILLALALVFSSVTVAFAEETLPADAKAVTGLGMLVGAGNGVTVSYLETAPTRIQAAVMVLRLKGLEATAKAFTGTDNFADANTAAWAAPIMAYLKANPNLGWIGNAGNFNPNGKMDAKSYYKVMLETLGYKQNTTDVIGDFTYANTLEFAASKGLSKVASVTNFTVNDLAIATVETLKATVKGSEKTLAASLVEAKVITEAAAVAAGVYNTTPVVLAVDSVTTTNLKQLTVKFNKEIKKAGDEDNYSVETDGDVVVDDDSDFALLADKKTVVITLTAAAEQQEEIELTIKDIEAVDGSKLAKTVVKDVQLFDNTIPTALSAKVIGNDTIKVTFSEPIETATRTDFKIDGGDIIVKDVYLVNNNTEANVELFSTLDSDKVKIEAGAGVEDFAGFGIPKKAFDLAVVKDTTAPVVVGYKDATPKGVTLIFNEDIQLVDDPADQDNFYHTNSANVVDADITAADIDGKELTLEFETNLLPEGTAYIYILKEVVADLWDNENSKLTHTVQVELDKTKPTVTKVEAGDTEEELVITFSEEMDDETTEDEDNYTILDKAGKEVANIISSVVLDPTDEDFVTITFTEELTGDYSIVIEKVEDKNENAIVKVTKAFNITDVTKPLFTEFKARLYKASAAKQMLKVSFGEAMAITGKYSVLDLEKYTLATENLADLEGVTIKAVDGNKAVEILIPSLVDDPDDGYNFTAAANLTMARVADAAGNYTAALASGIIDVTPTGMVAVDVASKVQPRLTAKDTVVITLADRLTKFVADDFTIVDTTTGTVLPISRVRHTLNEDGMSVITFTLVTAVNTNATVGTLGHTLSVRTAALAANIDSTNIYGEKLVNNFSRVLVDKAAPKVDSIDFVNAGRIVITFTEDLDVDTFAAALKAKNGFTVAGGTLDRAMIGAAGARNTVILTSIENTTGDFTVNTNVTYSSVAGVKDLTGNKLADFTHTDRLD